MQDVSRPGPDPVVEAYKKDIDRTLIREKAMTDFDALLAQCPLSFVGRDSCPAADVHVGQSRVATPGAVQEDRPTRRSTLGKTKWHWP
jgi:hypothetical protein